MKKIKMFMCMAMAAALLCHTTTTVLAASHVTGCGATSKLIICNDYFGRVFQRVHTLYVTGNGSPVNCTVHEEKYYHTIKCANSACNVTLQTKHVRTCTDDHTYCPDETGRCQYQ